MFQPLSRVLVLTAFLSLIAAAGSTVAQEAVRPSAMKLFPGETVLFVRTADARDMIDRLRETGLPRMAADPSMADFVGSLRGSVRDAYAANAEEKLGIDFDSLASLPQGELAFALVERHGGDPAFLFLADFRDQVGTAEALLENAKQKVEAEGGMVAEEKLRADTAMALRPGNDRNKVVGVVRRKGVFVAATDPQLLASVLDRWDGIAPASVGDPADEELAAAASFIGSLDKNRAFASSLRECLQGREEPPQLIAFADPIGLVRAVAGRQASVKIALATLPAIGVDAIEGAAAASWFATETWDVMTRAHVLVDNPRAGVMQVIRLEGGDVSPPDYVPAGVAAYMTLNISPQQVFDDIEAIVDRFQGQGAFRGLVQSNLSRNLGFDVPSEAIPILTGRVTVLGGFEESGGAPPSHTLLAIEVHDETKAKALLDKLIAHKEVEGRAVDRVSQKRLAEAEYYAFPVQRDREDRVVFSPCVGVLGGAIVMGSSEKLFKKMVEAQQVTAPRLADDLQYRLVRSSLKRLAGGKPIGFHRYEDPGQALRHLFQLLDSNREKEFLEDKEDPVLAALRDASETGDLPPVEDLFKYCPPSGSMVYDTDTGFHFLSFFFRCSSEAE